MYRSSVLSIATGHTSRQPANPYSPIHSKPAMRSPAIAALGCWRYRVLDLVLPLHVGWNWR